MTMQSVIVPVRKASTALECLVGDGMSGPVPVGSSPPTKSGLCAALGSGFFTNLPTVLTSTNHLV